MARVLVIEDDSAVRSLVARMLDRVGHEAIQAPEGREGLRVFAEHRIDLVITDINMPGMDGIQVIAEFRKVSAAIPIIAISGGGLMPKELLLSSAAVLGAVEVVSKPFEIKDLIGAVERALDPAAGSAPRRRASRERAAGAAAGGRGPIDFSRGDVHSLR